MTRRNPGAPTAAFLALALALALGCSGASTRGTEPVADQPCEREHHAIDYIELTVKDLAEAKRFYTAAFGWSFNDYGPDYAGIKGRGGEVGGFRRDDNVTPGGPLVILYSANLDETLNAVEAAGGAIVKPPFSFPGGRRFHFTDPSGNELAVWSER